MKAAIIARFGDADALEIRDVPVPEPATEHVLVRVQASALNRADLLQRAGRYPAPPGVPKDIPGLEFAGEVATQGPGALRWDIGARVFGIVAGGAHAEYLVVHQDAVLAIPDRLHWTEAAAVPEAFITAHDAMIVQAKLVAGESVLIHAVGSGVGLAATQMARLWGARPFGTSRTAHKIETARSLGLEDGLVVESDPDALVSAAQRWTDGHGVAVVVDLVGGSYVQPSIEALALQGRLMLVGTVAGPRATLELGKILRKRLTIMGTVLRPRSLPEKIAVTAAFARDMLEPLASGALRPTIDTVFPIERVVDAHRRMESNATCGKVVLTMGGVR